MKYYEHYICSNRSLFTLITLIYWTLQNLAVIEYLTNDLTFCFTLQIHV
jgi:hypothetical protein